MVNFEQVVKAVGGKEKIYKIKRDLFPGRSKLTEDEMDIWSETILRLAANNMKKGGMSRRQIAEELGLPLMVTLAYL